MLYETYEAIIKDIASAYLGLPFDVEVVKLYRGNGAGGFDEVSSERGLAEPSAPMGSNFGDLDGDGYLDFYLGTGYPPYFALMPNVMYWNRSGERFDDVTTAGGFGHLQKGHGVAFLDFDNDGDADLFEQMGGALAGDKFNDVLYENPGFGHHWLVVELIGVGANRAAIGARIHVRVFDAGRSRSIYKHVNSGGSFGASSVRRQLIGLGKAERIDAVEISWPGSDALETRTGVALDSVLRVKQR